MKNVKAWGRQHPGAALGIACYALGLVIVLGMHLAGFIYNRICHANGTLQQAELESRDFELIDIVELDDGRLVSTSADPQMLLLDEGRRVDSVWLDVEYSRPSRAVMVFYGEQREYDIRRAVYARDDGEGVRFWLPEGGGSSLRIDPAAVEGNIMTVHKIIINQPRPWYSFFVLSSGELAALAVVPALGACGLAILWQAWRALAARRKAGEASK